jgi:hypothetical protein
MRNPAWILRIVAYLIAWTAADAAALWLRFGAISGPSAARWFLVGAVLKVVLLALCVPRDGSRPGTWALIAITLLASFSFMFGLFWSRAEYSRSFFVIEVVFSMLALMATRAIIDRTRRLPVAS